MIISWLNQGSRSWSGCNRGAPAEEANFNFWMNWWSSCTCTTTLIIQHPGSIYWIPLSMQCLTFGEGGSGDYESTWESQGTGCSYCYPNRERYLISEHAVSWALAWQCVLAGKYIIMDQGPTINWETNALSILPTESIEDSALRTALQVTALTVSRCLRRGSKVCNDPFFTG